MRNPLPPPFFHSKQAYGEQFTNVSFWQPYVEAICVQHGLPCQREIHAGMPGTNAVFLVDGVYAVKLYPQLFNGSDSYAMELALYGLIAEARHIQAPQLIARGSLYPHAAAGGQSWHWPYLVTSVIPGNSYGEAAEQVRYADKQALAVDIGSLVRAIHTLPYETSARLVKAKSDFESFIRARYERCLDDHAGWGLLPDRFLVQLHDYLPPVDDFIAAADNPAVLHCDLNQDHILGKFLGEEWVPTGIIDFGDAKVGDRYYELTALHIGLFHADKALLRRFVEAYGLYSAPRDKFVKRAMCCMLLFEFNAFESDELRNALANPAMQSLDDLAAHIWDWEQSG